MRCLVLRTLSQRSQLAQLHSVQLHHCMTLTNTAEQSYVCILCLEQNCMGGMPRIVTIVHTETKTAWKRVFYYQSINQSIMNL